VRWVVLLIALMMYSQGIVLLGHPGAGATASISFLTHLCWGSPFAAAVILILTFPLSLVVLVSPRLYYLLVPQLAISLAYAAGAVTVIVNGAYADAYVPKDGSWFIYEDQVIAVVMMLIHFTAVAHYVTRAVDGGDEGG
jgi:hypothetical protein